MLTLNDKQLESIAGGFDTDDYGEFICNDCKATDRDDFSYQLWVSAFLTSGRIYRCKKCGTYILKKSKDTSIYMDKESYDQWIENIFSF